MTSRRRGMTLIEVMIVVAIISIVSALAAVGVDAATRMGRINGATSSLASALTTVRTRALTEHCTYFVQINGPNYTAPSAPIDVPRKPNTALVYRKEDWNSTVGAHEAGMAPVRDRLIEEIPLADLQVDLTFPPEIVSGGVLAAGSVSIGWTGTGQRTVYADDDADGTSTEQRYPLAINITLNPRGTTAPTRKVEIPVAGPTRAP